MKLVVRPLCGGAGGVVPTPAAGERRTTYSARPTRPAAFGITRARAMKARRPAWQPCMPRSMRALTADGEAFDQSALAAAHQTLQLPAVARLTNLENGLQVMVRINDRGPATPHRLVEVTRRTADAAAVPADAGCGFGWRCCRRKATPRRCACLARRSWTWPPHRRRGAAESICRRRATPARTPRSGGRCAPGGRAPIMSTPIARLPETVTRVAAIPGRLVRPARHLPEPTSTPRCSARNVAALGASIVSTHNGRTAVATA